MFKTQVFVGQPDDHLRTRLTHTIEVSQIARTMARSLQLHEDLTEAIALAHDVGHPPFGHAGERAIAARMKDAGGFEHNRNSLRILTLLEQSYPNFPGLNLSIEILETLAKRSHHPHASLEPFLKTPQMLLEGQVVDVADSITYDAHDIDDALRGGLISLEDLRELTLWRMVEQKAFARYGRPLEGKLLARAALRALIDEQVSNAIEYTLPRLKNLVNHESAQLLDEPLVDLHPERKEWKRELEQFLFHRVYRHPKVKRTITFAQRIIDDLFDELLADVNLLPDRYRKMLEVQSLEQTICDFVAGMTDRFAKKLHRQLFEP